MVYLLVNDSVPHVAARRRFNRFVFRAARARRRLALATAVGIEPFRPARPPAALVLGGLRQPLLRLSRAGRAEPVAAPILPRAIDPAGDMPASAEHERLIVAAQKSRRPLRRAH